METPLADIKIGKVTSQWAENNHVFVTYQPQVDSTNNLAKEEAFEEELLAESLCLYLTDHQTAGRGRGTHTWTDSRPGSSLLSSWSYLLATKPQPTTSCLVGLAVYRACSSTWPFLAWNLKAPNDIYIGDKKIAGILVENVIQGDEVRLIIGLGLNVTSSPESVETATSLIEELPPGAPLLGQDYTAFLDRLLFELTIAVSYCEEPLSPTDQLSLLTALNLHPLLEEIYTGMQADGSLFTATKKINWMSL
ncbi:biotin--[acetyl-CoA-carboxylase] ligase [Bdellovibrio svalbardensis]|uniref:Biotin--[acetyl-CoA-carboxylase] ligase n=1 Tax=Bdellovibrio svalbardensis TaxID=2972972 RepID=A0ABT6DG68_9BACT|nr:biotin--[acetyl-CoA-carboxylase] ligase [Bdellovibrio svalbardensis]MDG0815849.1 biotin--[acetyl-CoA-carboxylase] ligase [Bdellovibrio svalbardensis]